MPEAAPEARPEPRPEPRIGSHLHVFDPARFPCDPASPYKPAGAEIGTPA
ncbi:hypothetical protein V8J36_08910 [Frigidibacter sp. MR17.14]